jgi:hypothetical protein
MIVHSDRRSFFCCWCRGTVLASSLLSPALFSFYIYLFSLRVRRTTMSTTEQHQQEEQQNVSNNDNNNTAAATNSDSSFEELMKERARVRVM